MMEYKLSVIKAPSGEVYMQDRDKQGWTAEVKPDSIEPFYAEHTVYLVTYSINGCEPIHTVFNNKECADKMEDYLRHRDDCECDYVLNEIVPVFNHFFVTREEEQREL